MTDALYRRIGDMWECRECDVTLHGRWELFKHDVRNHYFEWIREQL